MTVVVPEPEKVMPPPLALVPVVMAPMVAAVKAPPPVSVTVVGSTE